MVHRLWEFLDPSGTDLKFDKYCDNIERWVNDEKAQKRFIFDILDSYRNEKVSINSLFIFMQQMTRALP